MNGRHGQQDGAHTEVMCQAEGLTRRGLFHWGAVLSAGVLLPACGGGDEGWAEETFTEPARLAAINGVLELHLRVRYADVSMTVPDDAAAMKEWADFPVKAPPRTLKLRTLDGQYMAPTLVLKPGDTLRMWVHNELPESPQGSSWDHLNHQNSTNMHFHGLHVDPREIRPGVFGDYVVDKPEAGVKPGETRYHEIQIPLNHSHGIGWYHPHLHGATNAQVSSGMFGAILIRQENDVFRGNGSARELVMFAHKMTLTKQGRTDTLEESFVSATSAFLLNGEHQPTIVMRPGEVMHWHLVNPSSFYPVHPLLEGHDLHIYARDGNSFNQRYRLQSRETVDAGLKMSDWPGNYLYPGGRLSMVFKASMTEGEYSLKSARCPSWHKPADVEQFEEVIARVVVRGAPMQAALPSPSLLTTLPDYAPITDQELAAHGGVQRSVHVAILTPSDVRLAPVPAGESWTLDSAGASSVFAVGSDTMTEGMAPFHSALTPTQTVPFNAVEEWTVSNSNGYPHPFHIHINDCYVVKVNGEPVEPFWADTLPLPPAQSSATGVGSITFRMRFVDFHGEFVWHCHALDHEDLGMMQAVKIVAP